MKMRLTMTSEVSMSYTKLLLIFQGVIPRMRAAPSFGGCMRGARTALCSLLTEDAIEFAESLDSKLMSLAAAPPPPPFAIFLFDY
jgi:hypothetical protein